MKTGRMCVVLARAPYFLFQDDGKESIVENPAAQAQGGAGIQAAQFLVDNDVNVLITVRRGQNAADVFAAADIKIYKSVHKTAADEGECTYIDCDVEEPNGRLFWKPEDVRRVTVSTLLPAFEAAKCTGCRECVRVCRFHALMYVREKPMVFSDVCHSCGLCQMVCPEQAVTETEKPIGALETGYHGSVKVVTGILNPGESSGIPVIRQAC
ncbi:MAG: 4Fe-4S binding protein [Lachnospiraceae bacterium]|nr:4Fe-4S binding protein [Lachnospiraceae bacterium]